MGGRGTFIATFQSSGISAPAFGHHPRQIQMAYNEEHGIIPQTIKKEIRDLISVTKAVTQDKEEVVDFNALNKDERKAMIKKLEGQMQEAAEVLDFELAAQIRDLVIELKNL